MAQAVYRSFWGTSDHPVDGVESINMKACYPASPQDYTAYQPKPEHCGDLASALSSALESVNNESAELPPADPLTRHALSYLNGGGGSGKTTRANEVFRGMNPLVFTPTHRLAKEMRSRGVDAQTYHSFFRWSGQKDWTPDRIRRKHIPQVVIWDEVCTVPRAVLEIFLDWLVQRGVQVVCYGDQGQPRPIAGASPHAWLKERCDYYEEVTVDYRSRCEKLSALKRAIRLQSNKIQCKEMRKALPRCRGWANFVDVWHPLRPPPHNPQRPTGPGSEASVRAPQKILPVRTSPDYLPASGHAPPKHSCPNPRPSRGRGRISA